MKKEHTYNFWKKKWDDPLERPLFTLDPNYPTEVDFEWVVWCKDKRKYGDFNRLDGPAIIWIDTQVEWHINGEQIAAYIPKNNKWQGPFYDWTIENGIDIDHITDDDKTLIKMVWG